MNFLVATGSAGVGSQTATVDLTSAVQSVQLKTDYNQAALHQQRAALTLVQTMTHRKLKIDTATNTKASAAAIGKLRTAETILEKGASYFKAC